MSGHIGGLGTSLASPMGRRWGLRLALTLVLGLLAVLVVRAWGAPPESSIVTCCEYRSGFKTVVVCEKGYGCPMYHRNMALRSMFYAEACGDCKKGPWSW